MVDSCANIMTGDQFYNFLNHNFDRHYKTNRAPLGVFFHASWLKLNPEFQDAFIQWIDEVLDKNDVYFTTMTQGKFPIFASFYFFKLGFNQCLINCFTLFAIFLFLIFHIFSSPGACDYCSVQFFVISFSLSLTVDAIPPDIGPGA